MQREFELLNDDEVLYVRSGRVLIANSTFKVSEFIDALAQAALDQEEEWTEEQEGWFTERGQRCEVLRFGRQGWQRGRVRIRLEFCPAEERPKLLQESLPRRENNPPREDPYRRSDNYPNSYPDYPRDRYDPRGSRNTSYPDVLPDDEF
ncbi:KGK domain-containing protein [Phormidium tenue FACHB-886]|nr:KGK domain-containing protein [Phormidium tenue FACHB-886]